MSGEHIWVSSEVGGLNMAVWCISSICLHVLSLDTLPSSNLT